MRDSSKRFSIASFIAVAMRWRIGILIIGLLALTGGTALRLRAGIDPYSLWLDDQWVAVLAKHASPAEMLELKPPVPLGFLLLQRGLVATLGFGSWPLQLIPLTAGLAIIPFTGWIAFRLTDRVTLGLLAAALLAGSRILAVYSLRVKQFTFEGLIVLVLIALAMHSLRGRNARSFLLLVGAAVIALPFSFTAAAIGLVTINAVALHAILVGGDDERRIPPRCAGAGAVVYDLIALAWLALFQAGQGNEVIYDFWRGCYLPLTDASALAAFMTGPLTRFATGSMSSMLRWFAVGAPLGIVLLCSRRHARPIGLALLLFYGGLLAASALHLYPLGGRRTDIFSYPVTILTIIGALWALSRWMRPLPEVALLVVIVQMLLFFPPPPIHYPMQGGRSAVRMVSELIRDEDALVVAPRSNWAVGCYGPWPVRFQRADDSSNGFVVGIVRPHTLVLRELWEALDSRRPRPVIRAQLEPFLLGAPRRLFCLSIGSSPSLDEWIGQVITEQGYVARSLPSPDGGTVQLYERSVAPPRDDGGVEATAAGASPVSPDTVEHP
jgi:hypothetical protein